MSMYSWPKRQAKIVRWWVRRALTALRYSPQALAASPKVFGNAMPKSGSHLIIQVLQGLTRVGPLVNAGFPPVNRSEDNRKLPPQEVLANLQRMRPGDIGYGYVHAQEPFLQVLTTPDRATLFVYRDPRDMIVSHVFYATQIHKGHGMHKYYTQVLQSMEQRINAQIEGVEIPGYELSDIRTKYEAYLGWLEQPAVLCLRFEDLILDQVNTLRRLLNYVEQRGFVPRRSPDECVTALQAAIAPQRSGTFRKAKPGNWREHFTEGNKARFKEVAGDLLIRLGYERDHDW